MILLTTAALALASTPHRAPGPVSAPAARPFSAQVIGCHPQPGKVAACATPYGVVRPEPARPARPARAAQDTQAVQFCHPDPSKNRGCTRTPDAFGARPQG